MNKEEFANLFVENNIESIKVLLKQAYISGYEQGNLDSVLIYNIDDVQYVDLGLPSGTLWAEPLKMKYYNYCYRMFSYKDAKHLNIPTEDQYKELMENCQILFEGNGGNAVTIVGKNGMKLKVYTENYMCFPDNPTKYSIGVSYKGENTPKGQNFLWLKSDIENDHAVVAAVEYNHELYSCKHFTGFKLPVFLVKSKDEIINK